MKHLAFITAVAGLGMSVQAPAQIYESAFKDTNGIEIHAPSSRLMLNPASPVTLTLISGLDRFVNVKVTKDTGTVILNTTTTRTGVSDRLTAADGSEFYGKKVTLPALGEGKFVVQINVLDLNQKPVATYNYNWLIDVTPPAANALTANTGSGSTAGDVWKLGLEATGQYDFTSSGVSDANGIDGFAPIFPDTCYHLTHYWPAAADIPVASDNPVHYADAIRYNARTPLQGSLLPLTRLV